MKHQHFEMPVHGDTLKPPLQKKLFDRQQTSGKIPLKCMICSSTNTMSIHVLYPQTAIVTNHIKSLH